VADRNNQIGSWIRFSAQTLIAETKDVVGGAILVTSVAAELAFVGVVLNYRRRGVAKCWLRRSLEAAREMGVASMLLEAVDKLLTLVTHVAGFSNLGQDES